jgi:alpha-galactosidase
VRSPYLRRRLAVTPPLGWNSWKHFANKVNDQVVRAAADAIVSSGMRDAGYLYVNIDDTLRSTMLPAAIAASLGRCQLSYAI